MIRFIRAKRRGIAVFMASTFLFQIVSTSTVHALTGGPTQPEVQSFQPAGASDMVDLFSGDFSYNIPLFELPGPNGGYPFNLSYQSGIGMDQEASWVGLGWSLQPGAMTRQMRGLPDEFNGDAVITKMSVKPSVTVGIGVGAKIEIFGGAANLGLGLGVHQNNYKGFGYSVDATLGFQRTIQGMTGKLSLGLTLDPDEGVGINPNMSLNSEVDGSGYGGAIGVGYNSKQGLSNVSMQIDMQRTYLGAETEAKTHSRVTSVLSLAHPSYTPQISMPMRGINLSVMLQAGGDAWGIFGSPYIRGFYSEQWLSNDGKDVPTAAYGYMNYQNAGTSDLLDLNREHDGMVSNASPNLATPSMTYDIYSVTGQGIGMMYRPLRNDYGALYDPETKSTSNAVGFGFDVGPALSKTGVNLDLNHAKSSSGKWADKNDMTGATQFQKKEPESLYEPWYFKVHGEPSAENVAVLTDIGGDEPVQIELAGNNSDPNANAALKRRDQPSLPAHNNSDINRDRKSRQQAITTITNAELMTADQKEAIPYLQVHYIDNQGLEKPFVRRTDKPDHIAAYTALTGEGLRYVYGIPAYNETQEDVVFSTTKDANNPRVEVVQGRDYNENDKADPDYKNLSYTDQYLKKTTLPAYAHSYLLTSIVGPDYVDVLNDGVTEDDLGYWVKFTYQRTTAPGALYKWRNPFSRAHYNKGWETDYADDKGSFTYGEKEMWYLAKAETKSHIAVFSLESRHDGHGVQYKLQDTNMSGKESYALNNIALYTREGYATVPSVAIKKVKFKYTNALCPGIENSDNNGGKLTLKNVWFEYGSSTRGKLNPYTFSYYNEDTDPIGYDINSYDRWGNYKPFTGDKLSNQDFPYVEQNPGKKAELDAQAAAWSMKQIILPSGGKILVDYEIDDYAYVQNKTAMQMVQIVDPYTELPGNTLNTEFDWSKDNLKIRFKLEKPIPDTFTDPRQQRNEVLKYLDQETGQVYFKLRTSLRKPQEGLYEYITGYADINFDKANGMFLEKQAAGGDFEYGVFYVKFEEKTHPFMLRAWQHLRSNQPDLANSGRTLKQTEDAGERVQQIKSLAGLFAQIKQMVTGFNDYCNNRDWGKHVKADKSWIRLNTPDKVKYGGGLRVKQITMTDEWAQDKDGVYGQVYDYTTTEGTSIISSGVAAYEPIVGGDENALRYARKFTESIPLRSDNNLFFEYPANESYYPGAGVGYSKVTVMSLPAAKLYNKVAARKIEILHADGVFPAMTESDPQIKFGTSGKSEHEFYTAKDFPVIADETDKDDKQYKLAVPIPFFGSVAVTKLHSTQGYSLITNDMHGKQKKVSNYRQAKTGNFDERPTTWVKYNYRSQERFVGKVKVNVPYNVFTDAGDRTLRLPASGDDATQLVYMGQEVEFFHDMRQYEDVTWGGGANLNVDIIYIPIIVGIIPVPIPTTWPNINNSTALLRTAVTNKIIFRSGVLQSVESFDGAAMIKNNNLKWDKLTGSVVLSTTNNNFNSPVYSYTRPAYLEYQGIGAAYQNVGLTFKISAVQQQPNTTNVYQFYTSLADGILQPGDEVLLYTAGSGYKTPLTRVIYTGNIEDDDLLETDGPLSATEYECMIVRSGFRNQLNVVAETITALHDPSVKGESVVYPATITVPKNK